MAGGTEAAGALWHGADGDWRLVELPSGVPLLNWIHGFAADAVTIVGNEGSVLQFDGRAWRTEATPTVQNVWGFGEHGPISSGRSAATVGRRERRRSRAMTAPAGAWSSCRRSSVRASSLLQGVGLVVR
jgi:hypothetical protein